MKDIKGESYIGLTIRALTPGTVHAWTDSYAGGGNRFRLLFTHPSAYADVAAFDLNGKKVYSQRIGQICPGDELPVCVEGTDPGRYLIQITGDQISLVTKMVLN